jgi:hypothetical protein
MEKLKEMQANLKEAIESTTIHPNARTFVIGNTLYSLIDYLIETSPTPLSPTQSGADHACPGLFLLERWSIDNSNLR